MKCDKPFSPAWRDMAYVPRWVIMRRTRQQYLAEHSYFVSVYARQVADMFDWKGDYGKLLSYALMHDIEETVTGDIPGPIKRHAFDKAKASIAAEDVMVNRFGKDVINEMNNVDADIKAIVSVADSIEEVCFLYEEMMMGNKSWIIGVMSEARTRLKKRWDDLPFHQYTKDMLWRTMFDALSRQVDAPHLLGDVQ